MQINYPKFFLASNSCEGFVSCFGESYDFTKGWKAVIIKGGPGCGKSSFMRYIAAKASEKGYSISLCPCSSDPDSLDGVIINDIKTVVLDGTTPHVVEPRYAGACEEIVNLGQFWDSEKLFAKRKEIISVSQKNAQLHSSVGRLMKCAGELFADNYKLAMQFTNTKSAASFAKKYAARYMPQKREIIGKEWVRFIGGITPKGVVSYKNTVNNFYKTKIIIEDKYGAASGCILNEIRKTALQKGYEIITLKNPFLPSLIIDHILIPELSLAFVTENEFINFGGSERRIHSRRFTDVSLAHTMRSRMVFNRRVARQMLLGAATTLNTAKSVHDELEKYYINAMNFEALTQFAEQKAEDILNR